MARARRAMQVARQNEMMWEYHWMRAADAFETSVRERHVRAADDFARAARVCAERARCLMAEAF